MPVSSSTIGTVAGLALAVWFALLCRRDMRRAVIALVALAWIPFVRMFELEGSSRCCPRS
jgi:hypothetical protein